MPKYDDEGNELFLYAVMKNVEQTFVQQIWAQDSEEAELFAETLIAYDDKWKLTNEEVYYITPNIAFDEEE
jgi:hypothetical protein